MKYFYLEKKRYKKKGNWIVYFSVFAIFFTGLNAEAQTDVLKYGTGNRNADTLGNHRVVLKVEKEADAVYAYIPWRRRDSNPEKKDMILVAESAQQRILNLVRININPEFGEYFDKDSPPDFWLVEMSGIPYGLMGEMLQDGGNQYRGMLYGMTARLPWLRCTHKYN